MASNLSYLFDLASRKPSDTMTFCDLPLGGPCDNNPSGGVCGNKPGMCNGPGNGGNGSGGSGPPADEWDGLGGGRLSNVHPPKYLLPWGKFSKAEYRDPASDEVIVYLYPHSYHSQVVAMAMHEKQVPFTAQVLDIHNGDQFHEEFLKLNPRGEVPVLNDGITDTVVTDTFQILRHLESNLVTSNKGPSLLPDVPAQLYLSENIAQRLFRLKVDSLTYGTVVYFDLDIEPQGVYKPEPVRESMRNFIDKRRAILRTEAQNFPQYAEYLKKKLQDVQYDWHFLENRDHYEDLIITFERELDECEAELAKRNAKYKRKERHRDRDRHSSGRKHSGSAGAAAGATSAPGSHNIHKDSRKSPVGIEKNSEKPSNQGKKDRHSSEGEAHGQGQARTSVSKVSNSSANGNRRSSNESGKKKKSSKDSHGKNSAEAEGPRKKSAENERQEKKSAESERLRLLRQISEAQFGGPSNSKLNGEGRHSGHNSEGKHSGHNSARTSDGQKHQSGRKLHSSPSRHSGGGHRHGHLGTRSDPSKWWLCSPDISMADLFLFMLLWRIYELGFYKRLIAPRPHLVQYFNRMKHVKSFRRATNQLVGDDVKIGDCQNSQEFPWWLVLIPMGTVAAFSIWGWLEGNKSSPATPVHSQASFGAVASQSSGIIAHHSSKCLLRK